MSSQHQEARNGHEKGPAKPIRQQMPLRLATDAFWLQWRILLLPWQAVILTASCITSLLVNFLTAAGAPPVAYIDKIKLKEAKGIIEHLHQREDGFRRKIKDMQLKQELQARDMKKLESKVVKAQKELLDRPMGRADSAGLDVAAPAESRMKMHAYFVLGAIAVFWFLQQHETPSLSRKVVWVVAFPEFLLYFYSVLGSHMPLTVPAIQGFSCFLSGFIFCHWLHGHY